MNIDVIKRRVLASRKKADLLLDEFPNAAAAYSLRLLNSQYTGDCIEVRRSSDDALQNIGFLNGEVDTASLLSFVGAGDGFVRTWYDQSGNGRDAIQTQNQFQPIIVIGGVLQIINAKPSIRIVGSKIDKLIIQNALNITNGGNYWGFFGTTQVFNSGIGIVPTLIQWSCNTSTNYRHSLIANFSTSNRWQVGGRRQATDSFLSATSNTNHNENQRLITAELDYTGSAILRENSIQTAINNSFYNSNVENANASEAMIGGRTNNQAFNGNAQEIIIYTTNQSSNRTAIEQNINAYYNIF